MDQKFTQKIADWLNNPDHDLAEGALMLYQLRHNPTEYRKLSANLNLYADYIVDHLTRFHAYRSAGKSHDQITALAQTADRKATEAEAHEQKHIGKRPDHDRLPPDIQQIYADNQELYKKMANYHAKLQQLLASNAQCRDVDILPFSSEIIRLDKLRLKNWERYDNYKL